MVIDRLQRFLADDSAIHTATGMQDAGEIKTCLQNARAAAVTLTDIDIAVRLSALVPEDETLHLLSFPVERLRRGQVVKLIFPGSEAVSTNCDSRLVGLVAEAHAVRKTVLEQTGSLAQIAERLGKCRGNLADMMRISYLAPDIVTAIMEGRQPVSLKRKTLMATQLSLDWSEQRRQLGFA